MFPVYSTSKRNLYEHKDFDDIANWPAWLHLNQPPNPKENSLSLPSSRCPLFLPLTKHEATRKLSKTAPYPMVASHNPWFHPTQLQTQSKQNDAKKNLYTIFKTWKMHLFNFIFICFHSCLIYVRYKQRKCSIQITCITINMKHIYYEKKYYQNVMAWDCKKNFLLKQITDQIVWSIEH